jgi:hypothetical protein
MVVRAIVWYVHDFFRNFLKSFEKQNLLPKNPGANAPGSQDEFPQYICMCFLSACIFNILPENGFTSYHRYFFFRTKLASINVIFSNLIIFGKL